MTLKRTGRQTCAPLKTWSLLSMNLHGPEQPKTPQNELKVGIKAVTIIDVFVVEDTVTPEHHLKFTSQIGSFV